MLCLITEWGGEKKKKELSFWQGKEDYLVMFFYPNNLNFQEY